MKPNGGVRLKPDDEEFGSRLMGADPTGCVHCREGGKLVLLVTGLCTGTCFYCPLSAEKAGRDVVHANELRVFPEPGDRMPDSREDPVRDPGCRDPCGSLPRPDPCGLTPAMDEAIIEEALSISATGTGITGGDPLLVLPRTLHVIRLLKERFGPGHHIHLYTATVPDDLQLAALHDAGLDEIRFHPGDLLELYTPGESLEDHGDLYHFLIPYLMAIRKSRSHGLRAGVEIPAIPGQPELLLWLHRKLEDAGCEFLNLNELEFSPTNADSLMSRGFDVVDDISSAVLGSREVALEFMDRIADRMHHRKPDPEWDRSTAGETDRPGIRGPDGSGRHMAIHFCSSRFKDAGQLRRRLHRRAVNVVKPHELITGDDTLLIGIIEPVWDLGEFARELRNEFGIPEELVYVNPSRSRVEVAPWVLQEIAGDILIPAYLIEEYPTADRLEVERENLNKAGLPVRDE